MKFDGRFVYTEALTFDITEVVAISMQITEIPQTSQVAAPAGAKRTQRVALIVLNMRGGGGMNLVQNSEEEMTRAYQRLVGWVTGNRRAVDVIDLGDAPAAASLSLADAD